MNKIAEIEAEMQVLMAKKELAIREEREETEKKVVDILSTDPVGNLTDLVTKFLNQIGAEFDIKLADGTEYKSKLESSLRTKRKGSGPLAKYKRGEVASFVEKKLRAAELSAGGKAYIPLKDQEYDAKAIKQATCQTAYKLYGRGKYATAPANGGKFIAVERLG